MNPATPKTSTRQGRLEFLDAVRGVAALLVVAQHTIELSFPNSDRFFSNYFNAGRVGVIAFFLVSGFIIPFSLERVGSLRKFWISRFFRLYPLYWFSVIGATILLILAPAKLYSAPIATIGMNFLGNLTMVQRLLGIQDAMGPYWTLLAELGFYVACSALFAIGASRKTPMLIVGFALVGMIALVPGFGHYKVFYKAPILVGTFFYGTMIYRYWTGQISQRILTVTGLLFLGVTLVSDCLHVRQEGLALISSWALGYGLFALFYTVREFQFPRWLLWLGQISYSIYLMHALILSDVDWLGPRMGSLLTVLLTIPISALTYRYIETPFVRWGKAINGKSGNSKLQPAQAAV